LYLVDIPGYMDKHFILLYPVRGKEVDNLKCLVCAKSGKPQEAVVICAAGGKGGFSDGA
jgi:hypothetical protein